MNPDAAHMMMIVSETAARVHGRAYDKAKSDNQDAATLRVLRLLRDAADAELVRTIEMVGAAQLLDHTGESLQ